MFDVNLTFDNGPDPVNTVYALRELAQREISATFFVVGTQLQSREALDVCGEIVKQGHRIGNHTYTHSIPLGERPEPWVPLDEIQRMHDLIAPYVDAEDKLFRPFGRKGAIGPHLLSRATRDFLVANEYTCVLWNVLPRDWENRDTWDALALEESVRQPSSVVCIHDYPFGRAIERLPYFLDSVAAKGGRFVREFTQSCTPIVKGRIVGPIDHIVGA